MDDEGRNHGHNGGQGLNDRKHVQRFSSGRELINAARANTERAKAFEASDPDVIDGVRVVWQTLGRAQRDGTAFQHALKAASRLNRAGKKMSDDAIIDAYREAYEVAHSVGSDNLARRITHAGSTDFSSPCTWVCH